MACITYQIWYDITACLGMQGIMVCISYFLVYISHLSLTVGNPVHGLPLCSLAIGAKNFIEAYHN